MTTPFHSGLVVAGTLAGMVALHAQQDASPPGNQEGSFRFRTGVELINVTATVSDGSGRFVSGLQKEDFVVYEDGAPQTITHFSAERTPVSLGIVLDTSGSMAGEKIQSARAALDRFLYDLLDREDEIFLYRFDDEAMLVHGWTTDRRELSRALERIRPNGGTAMYDAIADAVPVAAEGRHRKKALLVISDGNDTSSAISVRELRQRIRESETLVYAIGIDGDPEVLRRAPSPRTPRTPSPIPFPRPFPPGRRRPVWPMQPQIQWPGRLPGMARSVDDRVNVAALRELTDDSGGRTEIVYDAGDLNPATASIAHELSQQYYLGYPAPGQKDGRWHSIRVEVRKGAYRVRARRGYVAS
jgi:Ca-activated chloride channel family protein